MATATAAAPKRLAMMRAEDIHLRLGGQPILRGASCRVRPGRVTVLMGKNGAGKSTLLHCLAGERKGAVAGAVSINGSNIDELSLTELARTRAVLAQSVTLGFPLPVEHVVEMGCYNRYHELTARERNELVNHYIGLLDLDELRHRAFPSLSGGERKRALLAKCLLQLDADRHSTRDRAPRYLLLDEPTAALDLEQQYRFVSLATGLARRRGIGVLAVLHDLNLAARFADEIVFLRDGATLTAGPPRAVLTQKRIRAAFDVDCLIQDHPHGGGPLITPLPHASYQLPTPAALRR